MDKLLVFINWTLFLKNSDNDYPSNEIRIVNFFLSIVFPNHLFILSLSDTHTHAQKQEQISPSAIADHVSS